MCSQKWAKPGSSCRQQPPFTSTWARRNRTSSPDFVAVLRLKHRAGSNCHSNRGLSSLFFLYVQDLQPADAVLGDLSRSNLSATVCLSSLDAIGQLSEPRVSRVFCVCHEAPLRCL